MNPGADKATTQYQKNLVGGCPLVGVSIIGGSTVVGNMVSFSLYHKRVEPPKEGLATLPATPLPLVGGSAREVSDLAVSLNMIGVEVGSQC